MGVSTHVKRKIAAYLLLLVVACESGQAAGETESLRRLPSRQKPGDPVLLQIRISEAKNRREMLRYYKSVARQRKTGNVKGASDRTGKPAMAYPCRPKAR